MTLRSSLGRSLIKSAPGSLAPTDLAWEDAGGGTGQLTLLSAIFLRNGGHWWDWRVGTTIATGVSAWKSVDGSTTFSQATGSKQPAYSATNGLTFARASAQVLSGPTANTLWSTTQWHSFLVLSPNAADSNAALWYNNAGVLMVQGQNAGITYQTVTTQVRVGGISTAPATADDPKAFTAGAIQCWEGRYGSGTLTARVAGADGTGTALASPLASLATAMLLGGNVTAADYYDGAIKAFGASPAIFSAADMTAARSLVTTIYGVVA